MGCLGWFGGAWAVAVDVPDEGYVAYFSGRYTAIAPNEQLDHTMHYTQYVEAFAQRDESTLGDLIRVEFDSRGMRSWVKFSQFGHLSEHEALGAQQGRERSFDSLENFLAAGSPKV